MTDPPPGSDDMPEIAIEKTASPSPIGRLFLTLWIAGIASGLASVPVLVAVSEAGLRAKPLSWQMATFAALLGSGVIYAGAIFIGLRLGRPLGLTAPVIEAWLDRRPLAPFAGALGQGVALGALIGVVGVVVTVVGGHLSAATASADEVLPMWIGVLQALSAGVGEEILFRLGAMCLVVWAVARMLPGEDGRPTTLGMWLAILVAAAVFELAHAPPAADVTAVAMATTKVLTGLRVGLAVALGWLFWRRGIEAAMLAHFTYDVVLFYGVVAAL